MWRRGGGGSANIYAFMACCEVVWELNFEHLLLNMEWIMNVSEHFETH